MENMVRLQSFRSTDKENMKQALKMFIGESSLSTVAAQFRNHQGPNCLRFDWPADCTQTATITCDLLHQVSAALTTLHQQTDLTGSLHSEFKECTSYSLDPEQQNPVSGHLVSEMASFRSYDLARAVKSHQECDAPMLQAVSRKCASLELRVDERDEEPVVGHLRSELANNGRKYILAAKRDASGSGYLQSEKKSYTSYDIDMINKNDSGAPIKDKMPSLGRQIRRGISFIGRKLIGKKQAKNLEKSEPVLKMVKPLAM